MAKKFADLRVGMSPQAQADSAARAEAMLRSMEVQGGSDPADGQTQTCSALPNLETPARLPTSQP